MDTRWKMRAAVGVLCLLWNTKYNHRCGDVVASASDCLALADVEKSADRIKSYVLDSEHVSGTMLLD